ncbi:hypothetical protein GLOIN_2v1472818 [Rhizophagus irregularis DAOM 181602=DAOM 197198]|nr:hypothetical protein GLOIN_2v1472818 [Rhizophagus irregularis DAOM 181602=DAOM 197198]
MLIPFTLYKNNLDEHNDEHINYNEDYSKNLSNEDIKNEKYLSKLQKTELPIIKKLKIFKKLHYKKFGFHHFKKLQYKEFKFYNLRNFRSSSCNSKN